jgi:hypothetical protein
MVLPDVSAVTSSAYDHSSSATCTYIYIFCVHCTHVLLPIAQLVVVCNPLQLAASLA